MTPRLEAIGESQNIKDLMQRYNDLLQNFAPPAIVDCMSKVADAYGRRDKANLEKAIKALDDELKAITKMAHRLPKGLKECLEAVACYTINENDGFIVQSNPVSGRNALPPPPAGDEEQQTIMAPSDVEAVVSFAEQKALKAAGDASKSGAHALGLVLQGKPSSLADLTDREIKAATSDVKEKPNDRADRAPSTFLLNKTDLEEALRTIFKDPEVVALLAASRFAPEVSGSSEIVLPLQPVSRTRWLVGALAGILIAFGVGRVTSNSPSSPIATTEAEDDLRLVPTIVTSARVAPALSLPEVPTVTPLVEITEVAGAQVKLSPDAGADSGVTKTADAGARTDTIAMPAVTDAGAVAVVATAVSTAQKPVGRLPKSKTTGDPYDEGPVKPAAVTRPAPIVVKGDPKDDDIYD